MVVQRAIRVAATVERLVSPCVGAHLVVVVMVAVRHDVVVAVVWRVVGLMVRRRRREVLDAHVAVVGRVCLRVTWRGRRGGGGCAPAETIVGGGGGGGGG